MGRILTLPRRGDDRRQLLLREGAVAALYGEDTFHEIVRQSQSMPLPTPLGFGCGYTKAGDWAPSRYEPERHIPRPSRLQLLLSLPFCGFSSLSALINEATVNAKRDANNWYMKTTNPTTIAGAAYWAWLWAGYPSAGSIPAANVASTAPTATTAGAFGQGNAPASNTKHLVSATALSTVAAGALLVADMTLIVQPVLATTTAQTITGSPSRYQSNGNNGVLPFNFKGGTSDANAAPNITVTYTESTAGTTGHTTGAQTGNGTNPAYRTELSNGAIFLPLAAGDIGVRRIETTTWSVARSQATAFGLAYPYCWIPIGAANAIFGTDLVNTQFNLVQVIDGAAITFFLAAATTTSGIIQGELILVSGNS